MNPLDKEEYTEFLNIVNRDMPIHTEKTAKIPYTYKPLPKNLMEESEKVDNGFLNNNLSIIEEIKHRDINHELPKYMKQYQRKYYLEAGLLDKDNFFKIDESGYTNNTRHMFDGNNFVQFGSHVNGATIETLSSTNDGTPPTNVIYASKLLSVATVGQYYNQIAPAMFGSGQAGNNGRVGCYDDNGSTEPNNLLGQSSSFANDGNSAYVFHAVPEFSVTTAILWLAIVGDGSGFIPAITDGAGGTGLCYTNGLTFGSMPTPWGSYSTYVHKFRLKVGHS